MLNSVAKIDNSTYALTGSFTREETGLVDFYVDIISATGEVLNSRILNRNSVSASNGLKTSEVFYKNGMLFVTAALNGNNSVSILALDINLNELWQRDYDFFGTGSIYVDDLVYFGVADLSGTIQEPTDSSLHFLDISTGATIKSITYDAVTSPTHIIRKIVPLEQSLYLVGGSFQPTNGYMVEVNKSDGQIIKEIDLDDFIWINDLIISGTDFF